MDKISQTEFNKMRNDPDVIERKVIEDIKADIQYARESPVGSYDYDNGLDYALRVINKHCGKEKE